jgi:hypothetical protein
MTTKLTIVFATLLPIGILGGYFVLREALAPPDAALVRREGLAGIYLVEQGDQKFLVNSMGGIQKLDATPPKSQPANTPVAPLNPLDTGEAPVKALPTPPPSSYAARVLAQYKRSLEDSRQFASASYEQGENDGPKRSSFVQGKQGLDPSPASSPVQGEAPTSAPTSTPTPIPTPTPTPAETAITTPQLHTPPLKPDSVVKTQAEWAGQLAAENVLNPHSSELLVKPPAKDDNTVKQMTGPLDTSPVLKVHVVNNATDTSSDRGDETHTILNPAATPSPDDLVPSASPLPSASPSDSDKSTDSDHRTKNRKKHHDEDDGDEVAPANSTHFWQKLFKWGTKQDVKQPVKEKTPISSAKSGRY